MPPVRRIRSTLSEEKEPASPAPVRRRQAAQQAQKVQHRRPVTRPRPRFEPEERTSTPLLLRILSWLGIILLCFVIGYLGTTWFMDFMSKKLLLKPENRIENSEDLTDYQDSESQRDAREAEEAGEDVQQVSLNLYHVAGDTIAETRRNFITRTREDNIRDAVEEVMTLSGVPGKIKLLHVFRNGETAFLDMPGQFASAIDTMGKRKSLLLLTSLVRTMQENFSPLSQIRFLIDSKAPKSGGDVNLAAPWKMPKKS